MKRTPLIRRTPLPRGTALARISPLPKANRKRKTSEFARCYGSRARVTFTSRQPCAACGDTDPRIPRENAHGENGGAGRKGDATTILPLCHRCHHRQHQAGWLAIGMTAEGRRRAAEHLEAAWQVHCGVDATPDIAHTTGTTPGGG